MLIKILVFAILTAVSLSGCKRDVAAAVDQKVPTNRNAILDDHCRNSRKDTPCRISSYQLIASPATYDGQYIETLLYFSEPKSELGFINKEAALLSDYSSVFIIENQSTETITRPGYWRVWGRFNNDRSDRYPNLETYRQAGLFGEIVRLDPISEAE